MIQFFGQYRPNATLYPIMATNENAFADWVTATRTLRGMSQRALAIKAGVTPATISRIEGKTLGSSPETVAAIADALDAPRTEAMKAWLAGREVSTEITEIERIYDPDTVPSIHYYRGLSGIRKKLADTLLLELHEEEKKESIGGKVAS